ncbi:MAG: methyltransferase domain-containing protein [Acidobacteria bacterium]|nr:methyltransferase domain-containing protein [Acidobacteriota bacterium]
MKARSGPWEELGWAPRLRARFGYSSPEDYYEALVDSLVGEQTEWIDIGGGSSVFPSNAKLAGILAGRCRRLVAVDPSPNVLENPFAHERVHAFLENYDDSAGFTLATARMVVEHVARPYEFTRKLSQIIRPGGRVVIYTVNRWAPVTVLSGATPMWFHHAGKKMLWSTEEKDTFPVVYQMNTRSRLRELFSSAGFRETLFLRLDDCRTFGRWPVTLAAELSLWKMLQCIGLPYPESCLLGMYERV